MKQIASCIKCQYSRPDGEPTCSMCARAKQIANISRVEIICFGCFACPALLTDRQGRHWCQSCADASLYCLSCGESRREVGRQVVGSVECCNRCAHLVMLAVEIVTVPTCEVCGEPLEDGRPGCARCEAETDPFRPELTDDGDSCI